MIKANDSKLKLFKKKRARIETLCVTSISFLFTYDKNLTRSVAKRNFGTCGDLREKKILEVNQMCCRLIKLICHSRPRKCTSK